MRRFILMRVRAEIMENDAELIKLARGRAEAKVLFYRHFTIYVVVNIALVALWWFMGAVFPLLPG